MAEDAEKEGGKGGGKKMIMLVLMALLLGGGGVGGTLYFMGMLGGGGGDAEQAEEAANLSPDPIYFAFPEPFTVNFETPKGVRFLQVGIELVSFDQAAIDALNTHMPVINNNIILILSSQPYDTLISPEGKQQIRENILKDVQGVLEKYHGEPGVDEVYFTSFVMQ